MIGRTGLVVFMIAAGAAAGCHRSGSNAGRDVENPGQSAPVNTVQDVAAGPVGMASAVMANTPAEYVTAAAIGDMYEIQAGKIALERAKDPQVKALAQMIVDDHTKLSTALKAAAAKAQPPLQPPVAMDERRQGMIDNLRAAGDTDFDLAFLHQQLAAHLEALTLHKGYADRGDNPELKAAAAAAAPRIQAHLDMVRKAGGDKLKDPG